MRFSQRCRVWGFRSNAYDDIRRAEARQTIARLGPRRARSADHRTVPTKRGQLALRIVPPEDADSVAGLSNGELLEHVFGIDQSSTISSSVGGAIDGPVANARVRERRSSFPLQRRNGLVVHRRPRSRP